MITFHCCTATLCVKVHHNKQVMYDLVHIAAAPFEHYTTYTPTDPIDPLNSEWLFIDDGNISVIKTVQDVLKLDYAKELGRMFMYRRRDCSLNVFSIRNNVSVPLGTSGDVTSYYDPGLKFITPNILFFDSVTYAYRTKPEDSSHLLTPSPFEARMKR